MTHAEAKELLARVRAERPDLYSNIREARYHRGYWGVHIGLPHKGDIFTSAEEWEQISAQYPVGEVPEHLRYPQKRSRYTRDHLPFYTLWMNSVMNRLPQWASKFIWEHLLIPPFDALTHGFRWWNWAGDRLGWKHTLEITAAVSWYIPMFPIYAHNAQMAETIAMVMMSHFSGKSQDGEPVEVEDGVTVTMYHIDATDEEDAMRQLLEKINSD